MSISRKISLPIFLTVVGGFVAYGAFYWFLSRTRSDARFLAVAGMQAVRAEQIGRLTYTLVEGFEWAREPLRVTVERFEDDLVTLSEGGEVEGAVLDPIPAPLVQAMSGVASSWERVRDLATRAAELPPAAPALADLYLEMRPLLPELNAATQLLIRAAQERTERLRTRMLRILGVICIADVAFMGFGMWLLRRVVLHPLKVLETVALRVKDGDFSQAVPVTASDELGRVAVAFNDMSKSVKGLLEREKGAMMSLRLLSQKLLTAQDEERRRLARDLHDSTVQTLAAATIRLDQVARRPDGPTPQDAEEVRRLLDDATNEIRTLSYLLHPPMLERLGLAPALRDFADGFSRRSGVSVRLELESERERLPNGVALALFRVVQESLANVSRHAKSDEANVRVTREGDAVVVEVSDLGCGIPSESLDAVVYGLRTGVGIAGMRERMELLGGSFQIRSSERGTLVRVRVPVAEIEGR